MPKATEVRTVADTAIDDFDDFDDLVDARDEDWQMDASQRFRYERIMRMAGGRDLGRTGSSFFLKSIDALLPDARLLVEECLAHGDANTAALVAGTLLLPRYVVHKRLEEAQSLVNEIASQNPAPTLGPRLMMSLGEAALLHARGETDKAAEKCRQFDEAETLEWVDPAKVNAGAGMICVPKIEHRVLVNALSTRLALGFGMRGTETAAEALMLPWADESEDAVPPVQLTPDSKRRKLKEVLEILAASDPSRATHSSASSMLEGVMPSAPPIVMEVPLSTSSDARHEWPLDDSQERQYEQIVQLTDGPRYFQHARSPRKNEADGLLPDAVRLCDELCHVGDFDRAATLVGTLLLPRLGGLGFAEQGQALMNAMSRHVDHLGPEAKVLFGLGKALFFHDRPALAQAALREFASAEIVTSVGDPNIRVLALRTRLELDNGMEKSAVMNLRLRLAQALVETGDPLHRKEARALLQPLAAYYARKPDRVREHLMCLETKANADYLEGREQAQTLQRPHLQRGRINAVRSYGAYAALHREKRQQLFEQEFAWRRAELVADGADLSASEQAALAEAVNHSLDEELASVLQRSSELGKGMSALASSSIQQESVAEDSSAVVQGQLRRMAGRDFKDER